jgi:hypothetical protein
MGKAARSGRAVAIRRESIWRKNQRDQLNIEAPNSTFACCCPAGMGRELSCFAVGVVSSTPSILR